MHNRFSDNYLVPVFIGSFFFQYPLFKTTTGQTFATPHLFTPLFLFYLFVRNRDFKFCLSDVIAFLLFSLAVFTNFLNAEAFVCYAYLGVATSGYITGRVFLSSYGPNEFRSLCNRTVIFVIGVVILRNLFWINDLEVIYQRGREMPGTAFLISSGGKNIECVHLAALSLFAYNRFTFFAVFLIATVTSVLMESRAGIIGCIIAIGFWNLRTKGFNSKYFAITPVLLSAVLLPILFYTSLGDRFFNTRQTEIELVEHSTGRIFIWQSAFYAARENFGILGSGVGTSIDSLFQLTGVVIKNDNLHNIFLTYLLDVGIIFVIGFFYILFLSIKSLIIDKNLLSRFFIFYSILSCVQFTGYDILGWFFIGMSVDSTAGMKQRDYVPRATAVKLPQRV